MTLADFARSIGISPATARQWKKRGKIVEVEGGFELIAEAQREWLGITGRDAGVTLHNEATGESVTVPADSLKPENVTPIAVTACKHGKLNCPVCGPVEPFRDAGVTGAPPEHAKGIRVLTLERPSDTPEQEALRTAENLAGLPPSLPLPGLVDVTLPPLAEGQSHWTVTPAPSPDSAQDSRLCKRDNEAGTNRSESHRESCAGCEALQERVTALETEVAFLRTRVAEPAPDFTTVTASAPPEWLKSSNYSGSRNDIGEPYFD